MMAGPGTSGAPAGAATASWVTYIAILLVGFIGLVSLYLGFQNYGTNPDIALMYLSIGAAGFAAIGFLLFRGRAAVVTQAKPELKKVEVFTTLECPKCGQKRVRDFKRGDFVFKDDEPCTRCDGMMMITKISRKKEEEKKKQDDLSGL